MEFLVCCHISNSLEIMVERLYAIVDEFWIRIESISAWIALYFEAPDDPHILIRDITLGLLLTVNILFIFFVLLIVAWWKLKQKAIKSAPALASLPDSVDDLIGDNTLSLKTKLYSSLSHLDLDPKKVPLIPCKIVSLGQYLEKLRFTDDRKRLSANDLISVLIQSVAPEAALPLILLLPSLLKQLPLLNSNSTQSEQRLAHLQSTRESENIIFSPIVAAFLTEIISQVKKSADYGIPMQLLFAGEPTQMVPELGVIPNPFHIQSDFERIVQRMLENWPGLSHEQFDVRQKMNSKPINYKMLPGLELGYGGLTKIHTPRQECRNRLFAVLLNRIGGANLVVNEPDVLRNHRVKDDESRSEFVVILDERGSIARTASELMEFLVSKPQCNSVCLQIQNQITSFGIGMCVRFERENAEDEFVQIPLACALKCGITRVGGDGGGGSDQICSLFNHAGISLFIDSTVKAYVQYYEGVEGFCGWHPENNPEKPWQIGDAMAVVHDRFEFGDEEAISRLFQYTSIGSAASNLSASKQKLPFGGYGANGVCIDSVALIQAAIRADEKTTLYPILMFGAGRQELVLSIMSIYESMGSHRDASKRAFAEDCLKLVGILRAFPNDIAPSIPDIPNICQRMLTTTPPNAPFALLEHSIADINELLSNRIFCPTTDLQQP